MPASFVLMERPMVSSNVSSSSAQLTNLVLEHLREKECTKNHNLPLLKLFQMFRESKFCDGCCIDPLNESSHTSNYANKLAFDWLTRFLEKNPGREHVVFICNQTNTSDNILHSFQAYLAVSFHSSFGTKPSSRSWFLAWRNDAMFSSEDVTACKCALTMFMQSLMDSHTKAVGLAGEIAIEELLPGNIERPCVTVFKEALNMCESIIILCAADGAVIEANEIAFATFGHVVRPVSDSRGIGWLSSVIHPDDLFSLVQHWQNEHQSFTPVKENVRLILKDGTYKHFDCIIQAVKGLYGDVSNWVFKADHRIDHSKIEAARKSIESKTRFLAEVSHEIRTPLACIIGTSSLFKQTALKPEQEDLLGTIQTCSHQLFNLINNVLDFTKLEDNKLLLERQYVVIEKIIQEAMEIASNDINRKDLDILYEVGSNVPNAINCDELRLRQVLTNLLCNAVKFTDCHRTVTIRVLMEQPSSITFEVDDQGPGIPSSITPSDLFDSFVQLDASIARRFGGSGLGLAICKKIVNLMGGDIWYTSSINEGTTFSFNIAVESDLSSLSLPSGHLDLFVSYAEALAEYHQVLTASNTRYNIVISVASERLQEYVQSLLKSLYGRVSFYSLTEWLDSLLHQVESTLIITTNPNILEMHLADQSNTTGILLTRGADSCMSTKLSCLISSKRVMLVRRPLKHRQLIQTIQMLTTSIHPKSLHEQRSKCDQLGVIYPLKILIVDDNYFNQMIIEKTLKRLGYTDIDLADNGKEAVEKAEETNYNLILMDMEMPVMNGCDATLKLRANHHLHLSPIHIVALTANAFAADKSKCLQAGMCDFITKPVKIESIQSILQNAWNVTTKGLPCQCTIHCYGPIKYAL